VDLGQKGLNQLSLQKKSFIIRGRGDDEDAKQVAESTDDSIRVKENQN